MSKKDLVNRRDLLVNSATAAALAGWAAATGCATTGWHSEFVPVGQKPAKGSANETIVVGLIGCGDLGRSGHHLAGPLLSTPGVEVAAVCDVDANHRYDAARTCLQRSKKRVGVYEDYRALLDRKDINAVVIPVPDHWHALIAIAACEAGKDVYCEKPLTLTIDEGKALVRAARRYGTVFQTGSQQRSDGRFRQACELVRNGKIGKIKRVDTVLHVVPGAEWTPPETPPPELNWNFWLGPAPYADYAPNRVHYQFRWFFDYSGGVMTDWGAHHNDICQWGLGMDGSGPVAVDGTNAQFFEHGPHTVAEHFEVHYKYASGTELTCRTDNFTDEHGKFGNGIKFTGENGWIFVSRGEIKASDPDILKIELGANDVRLYKSDNHHKNWFDCIKSRERCICDVEIGYRSVTICHIGNISIRLGRPLKWDPEKEMFVGDEAANQMLRRPMRAPWHV